MWQAEVCTSIQPKVFPREIPGLSVGLHVIVRPNESKTGEQDRIGVRKAKAEMKGARLGGRSLI